MGKTLLVLGGEQCGLVQQLHEKDLTLAVMDGDPQARAFAFADSCLIADIWQANDCAAAAERYHRKIRKLDGIVLTGEAPMTAAVVSMRLHLPGISMDAARLINDRLASKRAFRAAGLASTWYAEISTAQDLQRLIITHGRDLILKPVERLGPSASVTLSTITDPLAALEKIRAACDGQPIIAESSKDVIRVAAFLSAGHCHMAASENIRLLVERGASALGIQDGPLLADLMDQGGELKLADILPCLNRDGAYLDAAIAWATGEQVAAADLVSKKCEERSALSDSSLFATHQN